MRGVGVRKLISLWLIICLSLPIMMLCGCSDGATVSAAKDGQLKVVAAGFVAYDFCREVLGGEENIVMLGKSGVDMHSFEPTAADVVALAEADVFVFVGGEANKWAQGMINAAENATLLAVDMTKCAEHTHGHDEHEGHDHGADEHVWLSLENAKSIVSGICKAVKSAANINGIDEKNIDAYEKNAEEYIIRLDALKSRYQTMVASATRRAIVVADRFPFIYLVEELGLDYYAAFPGCSTETGASFAVLSELIESVSEFGAPVVFMIDGSDGAVAKNVCQATGARLATLDSAQVVSAKRMADGESYLNIMEKNLVALTEALN